MVSAPQFPKPEPSAHTACGTGVQPSRCRDRVAANKASVRKSRLQSLRLDVRRQHVVVVYDGRIDVEHIHESVVPEPRDELVDLPMRGGESLKQVPSGVPGDDVPVPPRS